MGATKAPSHEYSMRPSRVVFGIRVMKGKESGRQARHIVGFGDGAVPWIAWALLIIGLMFQKEEVLG